ncbi:hypothetical protein LZA78_06620 [Sinirhodobacter sp. WL0062]|uniref:DUF1902 domain-containing protein n=1 Tax=Rhodobacter flavimaris TaxID=2907145 RepID=A0ABS8YWL7_9RHOB|nr:hypothetical protein [Sinirhodobacter sp. WL0062]MCE5973146.1 hypothetical protein [Sinirhodobacter sp. WL0062]
MPNVKLYVDDTVWPAHAETLRASLQPLRELLCVELAVSVEACQLAIVPVIGLADQPQVNIELAILPRPERTPEKLRALGETLRGRIAPASGGARVAVRYTTLDPVTYVALK